MDNDVVIKVENVSKLYKLYDRHLDRVKEALNPFGKKYHSNFHALENVSFEVRKGETLGVLGRNGSGKSTLLQIITGVLQPTSGRVSVNGKVSALLELGAGFNPELTGIQNIYFNGSILGYSESEMDRRLDDIISFSEIGEYIKQPIKTYSSGMYIRLAFACAVNVDPDVLIIDEALAVGDTKFQKKCFDKMNLFRKQGKTIILVTHGNIKDFASRGMVLDQGRQLFIGSSADAELKYKQLLFPKLDDSLEKQVTDELQEVMKPKRMKSNVNQYCLEVIPDADTKYYGAGGAWVDWMKIFGLEKPNIFHGGECINIEISISWDKDHIQGMLESHSYDCNLIVGIAVENNKGIALTSLATPIVESKHIDIDPMQDSSCILCFSFSMPILAEGYYFLSPGIVIGRMSNFTPLRRYENLNHLVCIPNNKYVFGLMNWPVAIDIIRNN